MNEQEDFSPYLYLVNQRQERVGKLTDFHEKAWEEEKILNEILDKTIKSKLEAVEGDLIEQSEPYDDAKWHNKLSIETIKNIINKHK